MTLASLPNLLSIVVQGLVITACAAGLAAAFRISVPAIRYGFWRVMLVLGLALPWLQTPRQFEVIVPGSTAAPAPVSPSIAGAAGELPAAGAVDWVVVLSTIAAVGILLRLVWIAVGCSRLRRLRLAGDPAPADQHAELQAALGTSADVRYVATVRQPVTFGVFRPVVLLPDSLADQGRATREAVIAHELLHVRRRDWYWVIAEELLRTALWFHPAIWWLISRVQLAREEVVDAAAVALTGQRRAYLEAMLVFADEVPLAPAPAFVRRRHLFRRIVLLSTEEVMSRPRLVASLIVMAVVIAAAGWSAVRAFPLETQAVLQSGAGPLEQAARPITSDNPIPTRVYDQAPVFPPEATGHILAVTVTLRMVVEASGSVGELRLLGLAFKADGFNAAISFANGEGAKQIEAFSRAQFRAKAGDPPMSAASIWPMLQAFIDSSAAAVQQWRYDPPKNAPITFDTVVQFTSGQAVTTRTMGSAVASMTADGAVRVGGAVKPPVKVRDVKPVYPEEARDNRAQGVVIIEARIEGDGTVSATRVLRSIPLLDEAALEAVKQWEFQPTLLNGAPTPVVMTVTVQFSLQQ